MRKSAFSPAASTSASLRSLKMRSDFIPSTLGSLAALAVLGSSQLLQADQNWDGDNGVGNFSFGNNWYGDTVGGLSGFGFTNGNLHFSFRNNLAQTSLFYDFAGFADTNDIFWDSTFAASLTLDGNGQGLNFNQRLENQSSFAQTIGAAMKLSGAKNGASQIELNPVNGNLTINGTIFNDNSKPYYVYGNNGKTLTVNSNLGVGGTAANVSFEVKENSNVIFGANQSYAGGTLISAGSLQIGAGGTTGTLGGGTVTDNASLIFNRSDAMTVGNIITGSGSVTQNGGTLTFNAANTYNGTTKITGGTLILGNNAALPSASALTLDGAKLSVNGKTASTGSLSQTNGGSNIIDFSNGDGKITFASSGAWTGVLSIWNYTGAIWTAGTDKLLFTSNALSGADLSAIHFYSGAGTGQIDTSGAGFLVSGELVPVPEPSAFLAGLALLGGIAYRERRHWMHVRPVAK